MSQTTVNKYMAIEIEQLQLYYIALDVGTYVDIQFNIYEVVVFV